MGCCDEVRSILFEVRADLPGGSGELVWGFGSLVFWYGSAGAAALLRGRNRTANQHADSLDRSSQRGINNLHSGPWWRATVLEIKGGFSLGIPYFESKPALL